MAATKRKPAENQNQNRRRASRRSKARARRRPVRREVWGVILLALAACDLVSLFHYDGLLVRWISNLFQGLVGYGAYLTAPALALGGWILLSHRKRAVRIPLACALSLPIAAGSLGHLLLRNADLPGPGLTSYADQLWHTGQRLSSGGILSGTLAAGAEALFSKPLAAALLIAAFGALLTAALRLSPGAIIEWYRSLSFAPYEDDDEPLPLQGRRGVSVRGRSRRGVDDEIIDIYPEEEEALPSPEERKKLSVEEKKALPGRKQGGGLAAIFFARNTVDAGRKKSANQAEAEQDNGGNNRGKADSSGAKSESANSGKNTSGGRKAESKTTGESKKSGNNSGKTGQTVENGKAAENDQIMEDGQISIDGAEISGGEIPNRETPENGAQKAASQKKKVSLKKPVRRAGTKSVDTDQPSESDGETYHFPPMDLLEKNLYINHPEARGEAEKNKHRLAETLTSFGVPVNQEDIRVTHGPSVTCYEFELNKNPGANGKKSTVKLSKITNLADDIALAFGSEGVRIAPIPAKSSVVGIEVPNRQVIPVLIRDVVDSPEFMAHRSGTAFAVGKDISGKSIIGSVERLPHVLIAGTTGSGKSVCMNSLIISLLYKSPPSQVRFIMIDPKMVELAPYNGIPHLLIPVVTDPRKAAGALQWAVGEMMKRYKAFSESGVKKLEEYNRLVSKTHEAETLPSVVVVIDELADLMIAAAKEVEEAIMRVAQMGRAAGIHLVIATQRPSADIITGLMKANIPSRIAFAVASAMESRIILDTAGAEKLVGRGDMLYAPLGESRLRVQGCFISPEEIDRVVSYIKQSANADYDSDVMNAIDASVREKEREKEKPEEAQIAIPMEESDELLPAAVDVVMETGQASVSILQRRLKLGYSRAARLIDQMEERKYVGPFEGSRPRQILITPEQWRELRKGFPTAPTVGT